MEGKKYMEISSKKITKEEISAKEIALVEDSSALTYDMGEQFMALGYVLETEIVRENSNLENDEAQALRDLPIEQAADYVDGYLSTIKVTVKHAKTPEQAAMEEEEDEALEALKLENDEDEQAKNDILLQRSKRELERSVAFTTMSLVRVYKTFWKETVSISDNIDQLKADLNEFLSTLAERTQEAND